TGFLIDTQDITMSISITRNHLQNGSRSPRYPLRVTNLELIKLVQPDEFIANMVEITAQQSIARRITIQCLAVTDDFSFRAIQVEQAFMLYPINNPMRNSETLQHSTALNLVSKGALIVDRLGRP